MEDQRSSRINSEGKIEEGNGELDKEEYKRLKNAFDSLDPDQTNRIDVEDLRFLLRCIVVSKHSLLVYGNIATEEDIKRIMMDLNLEEDTTNIGKIRTSKKIEWEKLLDYFKEQKKARSAKDEEDTCKINS